VNGKNEDITRDDLEKIGKNNDIQDYSTLIDQVINAVSNFENYAKELNINQYLITNIKNDLELFPSTLP
jgi:serine/threonine-protein kinase HipA